MRRKIFGTVQCHKSTENCMSSLERYQLSNSRRLLTDILFLTLSKSRMHNSS